MCLQGSMRCSFYKAIHFHARRCEYIQSGTSYGVGNYKPITNRLQELRSRRTQKGVRKEKIHYMIRRREHGSRMDVQGSRNSTARR